MACSTPGARQTTKVYQSKEEGGGGGGGKGGEGGEEDVILYCT